MDQWRVQPSEFDNMPYYRIEYMEEDLRELLNEKNNQNKESSDKIDNSSYMSKVNKMQNQALKNNSVMNKLPNKPNIKNLR